MSANNGCKHGSDSLTLNFRLPGRWREDRRLGSRLLQNATPGRLRHTPKGETHARPWPPNGKLAEAEKEGKVYAQQEAKAVGDEAVEAVGQRANCEVHSFILIMPGRWRCSKQTLPLVAREEKERSRGKWRGFI